MEFGTRNSEQQPHRHVPHRVPHSASRAAFRIACRIPHSHRAFSLRLPHSAFRISNGWSRYAHHPGRPCTGRAARGRPGHRAAPGQHPVHRDARLARGSGDHLSGTRPDCRSAGARGSAAGAPGGARGGGGRAPDEDLRQARHHHGRGRAGGSGGGRRDQRGGSAQHPGGAHLRRYDSPRRRAGARRGRARRGPARACWCSPVHSWAAPSPRPSATCRRTASS